VAIIDRMIISQCLIGASLAITLCSKGVQPITNQGSILQQFLRQRHNCLWWDSIPGSQALQKVMAPVDHSNADVLTRQIYRESQYYLVRHADSHNVNFYAISKYHIACTSTDGKWPLM